LSSGRLHPERFFVFAERPAYAAASLVKMPADRCSLFLGEIGLYLRENTEILMPNPQAHEAGYAGLLSLDPSLSGIAERRRVSGPGLRTFLAVADLWGLTEKEQLRILGSPSRSTCHGWAKAAREYRDITLDLNTLLRISACLGIYQALRVLHAREAESLAWLRGPHQATVFAGHAPIDVMTRGSQEDILTVRRFLDAALGGFHMPPGGLDVEFEPCRDDDIVFL